MKFKSMKMTLVDGGMHHLGAKKEDVRETMILTSSIEETKEVAKHLIDAKETASHREYLTYVGTRNDKELGCISIGHGCMPMAIAVEELNHLDVKTIVKLGQIQAIQKGIKPGTIIIPSGAVRSEGASREYVPDAYPACGDIPLIDRLNRALNKAGLNVMVGLIRSHDAYYAEQPGDPEGLSKIEKWAKLGVLGNEHECSAMFVLSEIFRIHAAAALIVKENIADGTALSEDEYRRLNDMVNEIITETMSR
ncbi:MAG: hypothetical protein IJH00_02460 [Erysipelotrichaceae bacterium]|nr:hypothetical protein [Erysipelotrichaceae bacterium]